MIVYQVHHMWYEANMIDECWDSVLQAARQVSKEDVEFHICFNAQTYVESPEEDTNPKSLFDKFAGHPLIQDYNVVIDIKTDEHPFYNIADWRREVYNPQADYTVWGETDTVIPKDTFLILKELAKTKALPDKHVLTFAGRPMYDNSWDIVTHPEFQGYSKPCQCPPKNHKDDCLELLEAPWKYKDYLDQKTLDEFNSKQGNVEVVGLPDLKIDGSTVCISGNHETPFIAPGMHFVREDTCFEHVCRIKKIPQFLIKNRLKAHNYWHPKKRIGTKSTRDDEVFKKYAAESQAAMMHFLRGL